MQYFIYIHIDKCPVSQLNHLHESKQWKWLNHLDFDQQSYLTHLDTDGYIDVKQVSINYQIMFIAI